MRLENPPQTEQYDPAAQQPVREMAILLGGVLAISLTAVLVLAYFAGALAPRLPFSIERDFMAERMKVDPRFALQSAALQRLAIRLGAALDLPPEMKLTLHYSDDLPVNAYATLGGHIVVFRGLISKIESENALAAVLAHEIAHIRLRHPAAAAGRGVAIGLVISVLSAAIGNSIAERIMGTASMGVLLSYSREQEIEADDDALQALAKTYGHLGGATKLFETLKKADSEQTGGFEFLKTHPQAVSRIKHVRQFARGRGLAADGPLTRLAFPWPESGETQQPSAIDNPAQ